MSSSTGRWVSGPPAMLTRMACLGCCRARAGHGALRAWPRSAAEGQPYVKPQDDRTAGAGSRLQARSDLAHRPGGPRPADFNVQMVNTSLLPRDKQGIWVLDFSFKPLRIVTVDIPGKGRRQIHYLYYKVVNRTGKPRMFVPQFIMVNENGPEVRGQRRAPGDPRDPDPRGCGDPRPGCGQRHRHDPARAPSPTSMTPSSASPSGRNGTRRPIVSASTSAACPTATRKSPPRAAASRSPSTRP